MYDLAQDLIAALHRLRAMLERPCPDDVLARLVQNRQLREAARTALDLRLRYSARTGPKSPEMEAAIQDLGETIEMLARRRSADNGEEGLQSNWLALERPFRPSYGKSWSSESGPPPGRAPGR